MTTIQFTHFIDDTPVSLRASFAHNGIGGYEFWGQKCFDKGSLELEEITLVPSPDYPEAVLNKVETLLNDLNDDDLINAAYAALEEGQSDPHDYCESDE